MTPEEQARVVIDEKLRQYKAAEFNGFAWCCCEGVSYQYWTG